MHTRLFALQPACHTRLFALQPVCTLNTRVSLNKGACHAQLSYINTHVFLNLKLKNIKNDYSRSFESLIMTISTVSTIETIETTLFPHV